MKEARKKRIFDLWLAGWTTEEVAGAVGISKSEVDRSFSQYGDIANLGKTQQSAADHATDFELPKTDAGRFPSRTNGTASDN